MQIAERQKKNTLNMWLEGSLESIALFRYHYKLLEMMIDGKINKPQNGLR
jgi:hypothetical protein